MLRGPTQPAHQRWRWRHSLYARALLFVIVGSGSILGAVLVQSSTLVEAQVDRVLTERTDLVRALGAYVEFRIRRNLGRMADAIGPAMSQPEPDKRNAQIEEAIDLHFRTTVFAEGMFVTDVEGTPFVAVPHDPRKLAQHLDIGGYVRATAQRGRAWVGPMVALEPGPRRVLVVMTALRAPDGRLDGYLGGFIEPATADLLDPLRGTDAVASGALDLVDAAGVVVDSTHPSELFKTADHGSVLTRAVRERREIRGRCHSCHEREGSPTRRETDVLAFAPLPTLDLGISVRQPEATALAPAFAIRERLLWLSASLVCMFLVFTGLSVHSVVKPLLRLSRAVKQAAPDTGRLALPNLGHDEAGQLAEVLEDWHTRLARSRELAEAARLDRERERVRRHEQRAYLGRVLNAQEDERRRIARDLHDTIAQDVAAYRLDLERLATQLPGGETGARLRNLEEKARDLLVKIRRILLDLRLDALEELGLQPALSAHLERIEKEHAVRVILDVEGTEPALPYEFAVSIYRIVYEAVQNAVMHGHAEHVFVAVTFGETHIDLEIEDDGDGFDVDAARKRAGRNGRFGLLGALERTRLLGGTLRVTSTPGEGTTVTLHAPLRPPPLDDDEPEPNGAKEFS